MKPREMKKAITMSQMTLLPKPLRASLMVKVPVSAVMAIPSIATAPMGRGLAMIPTTVATKMARRCHALMSTPAGTGLNQIVIPAMSVTTSGVSLALSEDIFSFLS